MTAEFGPQASWPVLQLRSELLRRVRQFFWQRGFVEVETPVLSHDVVVDRHLDPIAVPVPHDIRHPANAQTMWLQTSPEFGMKRLLAAGAGAIFQVTRAFRLGEVGPRHNPEFTLVEWYRPGDDYAAGMTLLDELCQALLERGPCVRVTFAATFDGHVGLNPHSASAAELLAAAQSHGVDVPTSLSSDRDGLVDLLLTQLVEPHLGQSQPVIVYDYPANGAALARLRDDNPPVAERFELYVNGVELANGYHELLDADVLQQRMVENNQARQHDGKPALPDDNRLLTAMRHGLPPCAGCALGFDRVIMLAAGLTDVRDAMAFPIDRA
jgi:lysyl-tRNA synthetase class 2